MSSMVEKAIEIVGNNEFNAVFDKGYYTTEEIHKCHKMGVETHVAIPSPASNAPNKKYNVSEFIYNIEEDTYTCPAKAILTSNGNWYTKRSYRVKQYKTKSCKGCEVRSEFTKAKTQRIIERHEYAQALERNKEALEINPEIYHQRQAIVEHPFGTMKRQWGFDHIMTKKTKKRASSDIGLIFITYNMRRLINIIGIANLGAYLRETLLCFLAILHTLRPKNNNSKPLCIFEISSILFPNIRQKGLNLLKI